MILARVIGNSVATVQHRCYEGKSVMVVQAVDTDGHTPNGPEFLAVDSVQAGPGDLVIIAREGNAARQVLGRDQDPFHSVILGVVDQIEAYGVLALGNEWRAGEAGRPSGQPDRHEAADAQPWAGRGDVGAGVS